MAYTVTIGGDDKTRKVLFGSLRIQNILTRKRDTCNFTIINHTGETYTPAMGREVIITDTGTKIFGGVITGINSAPAAYGVVHHDIECTDYTRLLDRKLVPDTYKDMTVDAIIADLFANYFPAGFTITNVNAPVTIDYVAFNYKPLAKCLEELADMINYDWYVDYDKDLHFFAKDAQAAPFQLNDNDGSYQYESLVIRRDNSQLRNTIVVRGGEYLGSQSTYEVVADGSQTTFPLPYRFTDFEATLTGTPLNIGVDFLNDETQYDAMYNYSEKTLRFRTERKPNTGSVLSYAGKPHLPVIVKYKDQNAIDATASAEGGTGAYEYLIEDKSINSKEGARQRAEAEVLAYAQTLSEGEFATETSGLRAGQRIYINSTSRAIGEYFVINKVTITQRTRDAFRYHVSLITTRTFDLIDVLQRLLLESTKKITINEGEIVDLVEGFPSETVSFSEVVLASKTPDSIQAESITFSETFTAQSLNYDVQFVAGAYTPTGTKRVFIIGGSRLG